MKKISTLFKKNPENLGRVTDELNEENDWVINEEAIATRKYDGTAAAIIDGKLYKRYDVKRGRLVPPDAIACQEPDVVTGHHPHWVLCNTDEPGDRYFFAAFQALSSAGVPKNGTYELIGEKVQGNPEHIEGHRLVRHGEEVLKLPMLEFEALKEYLSNPENDLEGIVFHHKGDGRMCKLRKRDFGFKRQRGIRHHLEQRTTISRYC